MAKKKDPFKGVPLSKEFQSHKTDYKCPNDGGLIWEQMGIGCCKQCDYMVARDGSHFHFEFNVHKYVDVCPNDQTKLVTGIMTTTFLKEGNHYEALAECSKCGYQLHRDASSDEIEETKLRHNKPIYTSLEERMV